MFSLSTWPSLWCVGLAMW
uniref:Uncharacterized protein n=1 Tax=Anguilla anguilla TaxID=7936 RepID=A0A0E9R582_ANGAN